MKKTLFQFNANIAITNTRAWADIIKEDGVLCQVLIIQGSDDVRRQWGVDYVQKRGRVA